MRITTIIIILFAFFQGLSAQEDKSTPLDSDNLNSQFQYIITKTESFQQYQVVKRTLLHKLKKNTLDSIQSLKTKQNDLIAQVKDLKSELSSLEVSLKETQEKFETATKEKDSLKLFGMLITKSTYYLIVLTIILGLIAALAVVFILFKRSNAITIKTKDTLTNTQNEFEKHRKWALEKEQKLSRELLKEQQRNKGMV
jgi:hypothetical protein